MANPAISLNEQYDALSSKLNNYPNLDKNNTSLINKAISDWQDWYYSEEQYDHWGDTTRWEQAYDAANALLTTSVKKKKLKPKTPVTTIAKRKVVQAPPLLVTGKVPFDWKFWLTIAGTLGLLGLLVYMDDKDRKSYE